MKRLFAILVAIVTIAMVGCNNNYGDYKIKNGVILYNTPSRPAGQQDMLGFTA